MLPISNRANQLEGKNSVVFYQMSLPLFYEPSLPENMHGFAVSASTAKHCVQVLRKVAGDKIELTDGRGNVCIATILQTDKKNTVVATGAFESTPAPSNKLTLSISLLKNSQRLEWLLEKVTEMGIYAIQPIICERTEHTRFRMDRMEGIVISAMLQSRQFHLPQLCEPIQFNNCLHTGSFDQQWIAHCAAGEKKSLTQYALSGSCRVFIGPEGDFTEKEIQLSIEKGALPVSLGNTRLRTETAGLVATALLLNQVIH